MTAPRRVGWLGTLGSRAGSLSAALVAHALLLVIPVLPRDTRTPQETVQFELTELPAPEAPPPEPPPEEEPEAPAGELVDEPERDPRLTSVESNREDDATPDEEVPLVTGLALDPDQLSDEGMGVRVGNTTASGFDPPDVDPADLKGFAGGGRGGGGSGAGVAVDERLKVLRAFDPIYPRELVKQQIEGRVVVRVEVLANGRVGSVEAVSSAHPLFLASVKRALRRYRFRPAELHGQKLATTVTLRFRFQLSDLR